MSLSTYLGHRTSRSVHSCLSWYYDVQKGDTQYLIFIQPRIMLNYGYARACSRRRSWELDEFRVSASRLLPDFYSNDFKETTRLSKWPLNLSPLFTYWEMTASRASSRCWIDSSGNPQASQVGKPPRRYHDNTLTPEKDYLENHLCRALSFMCSQDFIVQSHSLTHLSYLGAMLLTVQLDHFTQLRHSAQYSSPLAGFMQLQTSKFILCYLRNLNATRVCMASLKD